MIDSTLSIVFTELMPFIAPIVLLLGGILFADRISELLKYAIGSERNTRKY